MPIAKSQKRYEHGDLLHQAINHPFGKLTEALFSFMWAKSQGKRSDISRSFTPYFDALLEEGESVIYAKTILAEYLYYSYLFLPEWTETNIIPLFDWENETLANQYWLAFMYRPALSKELTEKVKGFLIQSFQSNRLAFFERYGARRNLVHMATNLMLDGTFNEGEAKIILSALNPSDKADIIFYLEGSINSETDIEKKNAKWEKYRDWLLKYAPLYPFSTPEPSSALTGLLLVLDTNIVNRDWPSIKRIIGPISNDLWLTYRKLTAKGRKEDNNQAAPHPLWNNPDLIVDIINHITPDEISRSSMAVNNLGEILTSIESELSNYAKDSRYIRLKNIHTKLE